MLAVNDLFRHVMTPLSLSVAVPLTGLRGRLLRSFTSLLHYAKNFVLAHDQVLFSVYFDVTARILAEQNVVTDLNVDGHQFSILETLAMPDGDDFGLLWLFLGRIGNYDTAASSFLLLDPLNHNAIRKRANVHHVLLVSSSGWFARFVRPLINLDPIVAWHWGSPPVNLVGLQMPLKLWPTPRGSRERLYSFLVEYLVKSAASSVPASVAFVSPPRICSLVRCPPYISVLLSLSGRRVAPSSATPANTPRERE